MAEAKKVRTGLCSEKYLNGDASCLTHQQANAHPSA
jgi:hypothetical protein